MKARIRKIAVIGCLLMCMVCVCGCNSYQYAQNCLSDLEGVAIYTEKNVYPCDTEVINVIWKNETAENIFIGYPFTLEKQNADGIWKSVSEQDPWFLLSAYIIPPKREREFAYDLSLYIDSLAEGTYRILTGFHTSGSADDQDSFIDKTDYAISVEFTVKE